MLYNTNKHYGIITKSLHWLVAIAMIVIVLLGFIFTYANFLSAMIPFLKEDSGVVMKIHKSLGLTILIFMLIRLIWRIKNTVPDYPRVMPKWQQYSAHSVHYILYALIFLVIIVGWMMSAFAGYPTHFWGGFAVTLPLPVNKTLENLGEETHSILSWIIIGFFVVHVGAALWHQFVVKDNLLKKMWF